MTEKRARKRPLFCLLFESKQAYCGASIPLMRHSVPGISLNNKANVFWLSAFIVAGLVIALAILSFVAGYRSEPQPSPIDARAADRTDI